MKTKKLSIILSVLLVICIAIGCHSQQKPDIRPHPVNLSADSFYQKAVAILQSSYDVDSTRKCISLLDRALSCWLKWVNWILHYVYSYLLWRKKR